ncbi:MAG TPA: hypothetical protein VMJ32_04130 [Pirellulales bacterium]|nr:hypothetical protein [Pirellulales bacterium]
MSTVMVRRVASTPERTASGTWQMIMELLAPDPMSDARTELAKASGVACSSISSEATEDAAIVVWGGGPRVRVYCVFGDDAISGDTVNEDALPKSPTEDDWKMSIPCPPEDLQWSQAKLTSVSSRISARSLEDDVTDEDSKSTTPARAMAINAEEFLKS